MKKRVLALNVILIFFSVLFTVLLCFFPFNYIEFLTYDLRFRTTPDSKTSGKIVLVSIGEETLKILGRQPNYSDHINVLEKLKQANVLAVNYAVPLDKVEGDFQKQKQFSDLAKDFQYFLNTTSNVPPSGESSQALRYSGPLNEISVVPGPISTDTNSFAADRVSRRFLLSYQGYTYIDPILAQIATGPRDFQSYRGVFEYKDSVQILTNFRRTGTYPNFEFHRLLENNFDPSINFISHGVYFLYEESIDSHRRACSLGIVGSNCLFHTCSEGGMLQSS